MSNSLSMFLKKNKVKKENIKIAATKSLVDENSKPLLWELKALTTKEDAAIRDSYMKEVPVMGKPGMYRPKFDSNKYLDIVAAKSIVYPDLNNKELQDSYGVMCAEDLVVEMIDNPGEYNAFMTEMQKFHSFMESMQDKVDEAKN